MEIVSKDNFPENQQYLNRFRRDLDKAYAKGLITECQVEGLWAWALEKQQAQKRSAGEAYSPA